MSVDVGGFGHWNRVSAEVAGADGPLRDRRATAPTILSELGDVTRLSASRKAVRCAGLDVGAHHSERRSRAGKLTKQGSPQPRWALYESAQAACRPTSPDRDPPKPIPLHNHSPPEA